MSFLHTPNPISPRWIGLVFWVYAVALFIAAKWLIHHVLNLGGWAARIGVMAVLALGLWPWTRWLQPRLARVLGWMGRGVLVVLYFTLLVPCALVVRLRPEPLRGWHPASGSRWLPRRLLPNTLAAAREEF